MSDELERDDELGRELARLDPQRWSPPRAEASTTGLAAGLRVQAGRRWRRRVAGASLLILAFLAGAWWQGVRTGSAAPTTTLAPTVAPGSEPAAPTPQDSNSPSTEDQIRRVPDPSFDPREILARSADPEEMERKALDLMGAQRTQQLFEAGDHYLNASGDVVSALRCYRTAVAAEDEPAPGREPNWLLAALLDDRSSRSH